MVHDSAIVALFLYGNAAFSYGVSDMMDRTSVALAKTGETLRNIDQVVNDSQTNVAHMLEGLIKQLPSHLPSTTWKSSLVPAARLLSSSLSELQGFLLPISNQLLQCRAGREQSVANLTDLSADLAYLRERLTVLGSFVVQNQTFLVHGLPSVPVFDPGKLVPELDSVDLSLQLLRSHDMSPKGPPSLLTWCMLAADAEYGLCSLLFAKVAKVIPWNIPLIVTYLKVLDNAMHLFANVSVTFNGPVSYYVAKYDSFRYAHPPIHIVMSHGRCTLGGSSLSPS